MGMFRKKPVVIEAHQFLNDESSYALLHWINEGQHKAGKEFAIWQNNAMVIPTLEGDHKANIGDWIIRGVAGEHYPCKPTIFEATYEAANVGLGVQPCIFCGSPFVSLDGSTACSECDSSYKLAIMELERTERATAKRADW